MRGSLCRVRVAASQRCYQDWAAISVWLLKGIFRKAKAANISRVTTSEDDAVWAVSGWQAHPPRSKLLHSLCKALLW